MSRRNNFHRTAASIANGIEDDPNYDYQVGESVIADGYPGRVIAVYDGLFNGAETYEVRLDHGVGGGQYLASQISKPGEDLNAAGALTAALDEVSAAAEASGGSDASFYYPELGSILSERLPPENLHVYAALRSLGGVDAPLDQDWEDNPSLGGTQTLDPQQDKIDRSQEEATPATEDLGQPDTCAWCGNQSFEDFQDTGRGVRARCAQCGGTMAKTDDGIQWQPEFPNSSANAPSRQGDPRAVINDPRAVHAKFDEYAGMEPDERAAYDAFNAHLDNPRYPHMEALMQHHVVNDYGDLDDAGEQEYRQHRKWYDARQDEEDTWSTKGLEHYSVLQVLGYDEEPDPDSLQCDFCGKYKHEDDFRETPGGKYICSSCLMDNPEAMRHHLDASLHRAVNGPEEIPPEPGTAPIPEGHVRLFHYTSPDALPSIREHGLVRGHARGHTYGEPDQVWAAAGVPRADTFHDRAYVEFHADPSRGKDLDIGEHYGQGGSLQNHIEHLEGHRSHVTLRGDVPPSQIVAIHEPWHQGYHYLKNNYRDEVKAGEYDWVHDDPGTEAQYGRALRKIKAEGTVHSATLNAAATAEAGYPIFTGLPAPDPPQVGFEFTASWADVRRKGVRLRKEGKVRVLAANSTGAVGEVQGDTATYETEFSYLPSTRRVAYWHCGCQWSAWANVERTPPYKRFQNRPCSHNMALRFTVASKGMFGREVEPDTERLPGQYQRSPIQTEYQRPTEHAPGRGLTRRTVPPGNVRTEWTPRSRVRIKGSLVEPELTPAHEWARLALAAGTSPAEALTALRATGMTHQAARESLTWAVASETAATVLVDGVVARLVHVEPGGDCTLADGRVVPAGMVHFAAKKDDDENEDDDEEEATTDPMGGAAEPGTDIPRLDERDQSDAKQKKKHLLHHTNDTRMHAPDWGYGMPWGGNYVWCPQCEGSGCGHCGGTGQVQVGAAPTDAAGGGPGDLSATTDPVGDESPDAGDMQQSDPIGATSASLHTASYDNYSLMPGNPAQLYQSTTPHSDSPNPASIGWATSADPGNWSDSAVSSGFTHWDAAAHGEAVSNGYDDVGEVRHGASGLGEAWQGRQASNGGSPQSDPPTHAGLCLKAGDTGRVLMIQRSNHDPDDPAAGTWEFPGGKLEDGDQTSLHGAIREWEEEVGQAFPPGGHLTGVHRNRNYVLHMVHVPEESAVSFKDGRATLNPDDPDGDDHEQAAWWTIQHAKANPALRREVKSTPWDEIKKAASVTPVTSVRGNGVGPTYEQLSDTTAALESPREKATDPDWKIGFTHAIDDQPYQLPDYEQGEGGYIRATRYAQGYQEGRESQGQKWGKQAATHPEGESPPVLDVQRSLDQAREQEAAAHQDDVKYAVNWEPLHRSDIPPAEHHGWMFMENNPGTTFHEGQPQSSVLSRYKHGISRVSIYLGPDGGAYRPYERRDGSHAFEGPFSARQQLQTKVPCHHMDADGSTSTHLHSHYDQLAELGAEPGTAYDTNYQIERNRRLRGAGFDVVSTLNEEPEPALPSTDGTTEEIGEPGPEQQVEHAAQPGIETMREQPWGYPEDSPPFIPEGDDRGLTDDTDNNDALRIQGAVDPVVAAFWATSGGQALMHDAPPPPQSERQRAMNGSGGSRAGAEYSDAQIAAAARTVLQKAAGKDFTFAEQQALINENLTGRARNFTDLQVQGTHYEHLLDDGEHSLEDETLFL
jgi:8-oxo-dGTP pyrophosphatase MutT (NUDIX family)